MLAQFNLGSMFLLGQEVQKNEAEAEKWLTKAALQGHEQAKFICELCIGSDEMLMSENGKVIKNRSKICVQEMFNYRNWYQ